VARRSIAEAPADINITTNSSFVLAADRTHRRDPLNGFRKYPGGWNISEVHYFAVSFVSKVASLSAAHICCLHYLIFIALIFFPWFVVCWIYSHSPVCDCPGVVCVLFSGYAWDLLPSLLLPTSQLQVF